MTDQLTNLQALFTRRFLFNALLPTLVVLSLDVAAFAVFFGRWDAVVGWWATTDTLSRIVAIGGYGTVVWFLSVAVGSQWRNIVRTYEGYPAVALARRVGVRTAGVRWHQRNLREVREVRLDKNAAYYQYPRSKWSEEVLPTRLGNILLAAEKYPQEHYGIDPVLFWPRLYPLLPEQFQRDYEEFVREYEFPLVVSLLSALSGGLLAAAALISGQSAMTYLVAFVIPITVSYAAYAVSLPAAIEMGEQQRTAFDLYRGLLLDAWPTVEDVKDECEAFDSIGDFIVRNATPAWDAPQQRSIKRKTVGIRKNMTVRPTAQAQSGQRRVGS